MAQDSGPSTLQILAILFGCPAAFVYIWWLVVKTFRLRYRFNGLSAHAIGCAAGVVMTLIFFVLVFIWNPVALLVGCALAGAAAFMHQELSALRSALLPSVKPAPDTRVFNPIKKISLPAPNPRPAVVPVAEPLVSEPGAGSTDSIDEIEFDYTDASGVRSHRSVSVYAVDDEYFEGFCHQATDTRTFVIGRVRGKVLVRDTGELLPAKRWAAAARMDPNNTGLVMNRGWRPDADEEAHDYIDIEILFTGFPRAQRAELEALAEASGMVVRKSVTVDLSYLCAGPNAGPAKLAQARDARVSIIDHEEFLSLAGIDAA